MNKYESEIFARAYQSYLMGGDIHVVNYNKKPDVNKKYADAVKALSDAGFIEITFESEIRIKFRLTDKGIDYGSSQY